MSILFYIFDLRCKSTNIFMKRYVLKVSYLNIICPSSDSNFGFFRKVCSKQYCKGPVVLRSWMLWVYQLQKFLKKSSNTIRLEVRQLERLSELCSKWPLEVCSLQLFSLSNHFVKHKKNAATDLLSFVLRWSDVK